LSKTKIELNKQKLMFVNRDLFTNPVI
jgi:hypothetical protein